MKKIAARSRAAMRQLPINGAALPLRRTWDASLDLSCLAELLAQFVFRPHQGPLA
jgi:hypothetical protein